MELRKEDSKSYGSFSEEKVEVGRSQSVSVGRQHKVVVICSAVVVGLVLLSIIIAVVYKELTPSPETLGSGPFLYSEYETAAVASDGAPCAKVELRHP